MKKNQPIHLQIFLSFFKLGCMAFGGPVAHLGYFQKEFIQKRKWLGESQYADLVALCNFLPGPTSSQVGFAIGYSRGGVTGAFLAWIGFTLPSVILMIGFALGLSLGGDFEGAGWIAGLKLAAVAVVADAIWSMAIKLSPDPQRALVTLASAAILLTMKDPFWQVVVVVSGALVGLMLFNHKAPNQMSEVIEKPSRTGWPYLLAFCILLIGLPLLGNYALEGWLAVVDGFYRAGSLVFGGGHVVLPMLDSFTVGQGWIDEDTFLAGYGAAQALPGPLFSFTAFLGTLISEGPGGFVGGILALTATYLPSWLLVLGALPYWEQLRRMKSAQAALMGTNAAVVGLLLAAFYDPVWKVAVTDSSSLAFALIAFGLLRFAKCPPWLLVILSAGAGYFLFR